MTNTIGFTIINNKLLTMNKKIMPFTNYEEVLATTIVKSCCYYLYDTLERNNDCETERRNGIRGLYQVVWKLFKLNGVERDYPSIKTH